MMNPRTRAFTLIELMAVIVIASLVTAMGAISIGGVMRQTQFQRTVAAFMQMDARARLHARTGGSAMQMRIDADARTMKLVERAIDFTTEADALAQVDIPPEIAVIVEAPSLRSMRGSPTGAIIFNRMGASPDYALEFRDGISARRLEIAGLTGEVRVTEPTP